MDVVKGKIKGLQQILSIAKEYDSVPERGIYDQDLLFGDVLLDNYDEYQGYSPADISELILLEATKLEDEHFKPLPMVSFQELHISKICNVSEEYERFLGMAGSIFGKRSETIKSLEIATDNVKAVIAEIEMETHKLGHIPVEDDPTKKIKITGAAMTAYVNSHPRTKKAREERAEAEYLHDYAKGIVTYFNKVMDALPVIQSDRKNEFYTGTTKTSSSSLMQ